MYLSVCLAVFVLFLILFDLLFFLVLSSLLVLPLKASSVVFLSCI